MHTARATTCYIHSSHLGHTGQSSCSGHTGHRLATRHLLDSCLWRAIHAARLLCTNGPRCFLGHRHATDDNWRAIHAARVARIGPLGPQMLFRMLVPVGPPAVHICCLGHSCHRRAIDAARAACATRVIGWPQMLFGPFVSFGLRPLVSPAGHRCCSGHL